MQTIVVKTQAELDALPVKFEKWTRIEIRSTERIRVSVKRENASVVARDDASVEAYDNTTVVARENASVEAYDNATVVARDNASVEAYDNASVVARDDASVEAYDNTTVVARENASVEAYGNAFIEARNSASVLAHDNASVEALDDASILAQDNASVVARDNASVEATGSASVEALDNTFIVAWGKASVVAYQFAVVSVFSFGEIRLFDWAVGRLKAKDLKPETFGDKVTLINDFEAEGVSFETWLERGYVMADGIASKLVEQSKDGDVDVFKAADFRKKEVFVVRKGNRFAHGDTLVEAKADLDFKINGRDTTRFKEWKRDEARPIEEMIVAYRAITGACQKGVRDFMKGLPNLPEEISPAQVIGLVGNSYGADEFRDFFEGVQ